MGKWWWMNWGWKKNPVPYLPTNQSPGNKYFLVGFSDLVSAVFENPGALVICFKQMNRLDMSEKNDASSFPILATRCKKDTIWRDTPSSFLHTENEAVILSGHFLKYHSKLGTSPSLGWDVSPSPSPMNCRRLCGATILNVLPHVFHAPISVLFDHFVASKISWFYLDEAWCGYCYLRFDG